MCIFKKTKYPCWNNCRRKYKNCEEQSCKAQDRYFISGIDNKLSIVEKLCVEHKISIDQVAYWNDIGDYRLLKSVGFSAAPNNFLNISKMW